MQEAVSKKFYGKLTNIALQRDSVTKHVRVFIIRVVGSGLNSENWFYILPILCQKASIFVFVVLYIKPVS